jgi:hypothetical protein
LLLRVSSGSSNEELRGVTSAGAPMVKIKKREREREREREEGEEGDSSDRSNLCGRIVEGARPTKDTVQRYDYRHLAMEQKSKGARHINIVAGNHLAKLFDHHCSSWEMVLNPPTPARPPCTHLQWSGQTCSKDQSELGTSVRRCRRQTFARQTNSTPVPASPLRDSVLLYK